MKRLFINIKEPESRSTWGCRVWRCARIALMNMQQSHTSLYLNCAASKAPALCYLCSRGGPPALHVAAGMAGACHAPHLLQPIPYMHCPSAMHHAPTNSQGCAEHALTLGEEQDGVSLSCRVLLPVTEGGRRAIWKTSEYCRLVDLMKNVIFIQMAHLKSMN